MKCVDCKKTITHGYPIFKKGTSCGDEEDYSGKHICFLCLKDSDEYGMCTICGEEAAYDRDDLRGEDQDCCEEHHDVLCDEEKEDMESFIEYYQDPNHGGD
jgi:hypothetical protein